MEAVFGFVRNNLSENVQGASGMYSVALSTNCDKASAK